VFVCCGGRDICDEPITRSEQSYGVCVCVSVCLIVFDLDTSTVSRHRPEFGCWATENKNTVESNSSLVVNCK
jgi:hypothetical protein